MKIDPLPALVTPRSLRVRAARQQQLAANATLASVDGALHVRMAELKGDLRKPVPLSAFLDALAAWNASAVYVATDLPGDALENFRKAATVRTAAVRSGLAAAGGGSASHPSGAVNFVRRPTNLPPAGVMAQDFVRSLGGPEVRALTTDALLDMYLLVAAPMFVGSASNWASLVLLLRLAMPPPVRFVRSMYLQKRKAARREGRGVTAWKMEECVRSLSTCMLLPLWRV